MYLIKLLLKLCELVADINGEKDRRNWAHGFGGLWWKKGGIRFSISDPKAPSPPTHLNPTLQTHSSKTQSPDPLI